MEPTLKFESRKEYRKWLIENYSKIKSIWIKFYKDGTRCISYDEALNESLCFGWIDSLIKKIDEKVYVRKFSKRNSNSKWSQVNKKKVKELIDNGLMTKYGLKAVEDAKYNGKWNKIDQRDEINTDEFRNIIKDKIISIADYDNLTESLKKHYSFYYFNAKRSDTKNKRLEIIIEYMKSKKCIM